MPTTLVETFDSVEIIRNYDQSEIIVRAKIIGEEDTPTAETDFYAFLATHPDISNGYLSSSRIVHIGGGVHEAEAVFLQNNAEIVKTIRYRTTGETAKVIQGFGTVYSTSLSGSAPNLKGLINVTKDGADGVEIPVPSFSFSVDFRFSAVDQSYINLCHFLTGCVNNAQYLGFDAGELLFDGIEGEIGMTSGGAIVLSSSPISFNFRASPNVQNLTVGPFTVPFKYGWDYMWTRTVDDTDANATIKVPQQLYIDRPLRWADLSQLGI